MAHDVFISYAVEDKPTADAACATLEARRTRCWIAPRDVLPGVDYAEAIVEAISQSRVMVLVFSSRSNHSPHVRREVERAVSAGIPILPFRIEDVPLSPSLDYFIGAVHWLDALTPPLERHLDHLAETVGLLLSRAKEPEEVGEESRAPAPPAPVEAGVGERMGKLAPARRAFEPVKSWLRHPKARIALGAGGIALAAVVVLLALQSDGGEGDSGPAALPSTPSEHSPTVVTPQPTLVPTPLPSPTAAHGEVVTEFHADGFGAPGGPTNGMACDGTHLWIVAALDLFEVDTDGKVVASYPPPEYSPEGLAWDGATFWIFTTNYSKIIQFSIDESGDLPETRIISSFQSPNQRIGGANDGLAWDGAALWYADSYRVYRLDTAGSVLSSLAFGDEVAGLAWDGEHLWLAHNSPPPENATLVKTDTEGTTLLTFSGGLYEIDALTWCDGHLWAAGAASLDGPQMIYRIDMETKVVGLTPTE